MATQYHVAGVVSITFGGTSIGQTDGQVLITIRDVAPFEPITTDAYGGEAEDFIQLSRHAIVTLDLIEWDTAVLDDVRGAIAAASVPATPAFDTPGTQGEVGMLRIADGGYKQLVVAGDKVTTKNGFQQFTFERAFIDPDTPFEFEDVGARRPTRASITFRCQPNDSGTIYTPASIT